MVFVQASRNAGYFEPHPSYPMHNMSRPPEETGRDEDNNSKIVFL